VDLRDSGGSEHSNDQSFTPRNRNTQNAGLPSIAYSAQSKRLVGRVEVEVCCFHSLRNRLVSKRKLANAGPSARSPPHSPSITARQPSSKPFVSAVYLSPHCIYIDLSALLLSLQTTLQSAPTQVSQPHKSTLTQACSKMLFLKAIFCLFIGLVAFINAVPISEDDLQRLDVDIPGLNISGTSSCSLLFGSFLPIY
jgi:hypothetical protein